MNGIHLLHALFSGQTPGSAALKDLENPENRAFLETLLQTEGLADSGFTLDDLEQWLSGDGGNTLPQLAAQRQSLPTLPPLPERATQLPGQTVAADDAHTMLSDKALNGEQLTARLALLDQLQMKRVLSNQVSASPVTRQEPDATALLQSYTQASQSLEAGGRSSLPSFTVGTPMDQSGWGQALGDRLVMLTKQGVHQARLQLNPKELGPVEVNIRVKDDTTTITFTAMHAVTREALDAELPRLQRMLQENGFQEASVDVNRDQNRNFADQGSDDEGPGSQSNQAKAGSEPIEADLTNTRINRHQGIIDHYA